MTLETEKRSYTIAEYLALEETATERHKYRDGEIVLMTGGTTDHNQKTPEGKWLLTEYESPDAVLSLALVPFKISLKKLYAEVDFMEED